MNRGMPNDNKSKWCDTFYVKAYQLAVGGMTDHAIGRAMGVKEDTFYKWVRSKPALQDALNQARSKGAGTRAFMRMVSQKIPDDLKKLWEDLSNEDDATRSKAYTSLKDGDKRRTQSVWVHAYIVSNFNETRANEMTGIGEMTVYVWRKNDKDFKKLVEFIKQCRGDFCENALMEKIHEGDTASIIFANKTLNKDRGYDTRINVEVKGEIEHKNTISVKDLPPEKLRELLELARSKKSLPQLEDSSKIQDAEFSVKPQED